MAILSDREIEYFETKMRFYQYTLKEYSTEFLFLRNERIMELMNIVSELGYFFDFKDKYRLKRTG